MRFGKWRERLVKDFKKKEFIPIKGLFFLIYGANVSLIPFLTLQARSLGISEEEVGIIYSFIPIAALIAPPLSGMLADKIGNFRILLSLVTAMAGLCGLLFILVPPGRIIHPLPDVLSIRVACTPGSGSEIKVPDPYQCEPTLSLDNFPLDLENCHVTCFMTGAASEEYLPSSGNETEKLSPSSRFPVTVNPNLITEVLNASMKNNTFRVDSFLCPELNATEETGKNCFTSCEGKTKKGHICLNQFYVEELNPSVTFYSHLVIRFLKEFTLSTSLPLLEGAAVTILKEHKGDFGFQRLFCNLGMMVMTPISGTLIDYFSVENGQEDYRPAMYMYCGLKLVAAIIILFLNLEFKKASNKIISDFSSMMLNPEIICFLIATFLAGTCYGYIETFLFWLLEDLGADKQLMGLTLTVGSVFGIPLLMVSTFILKKLGHVNTIVLGFSVYIFRLFGYTLISSPWWAMPFEALECVTVSLMVVSFVSYAAVLATPTTVVTLQGMYGGLYNGVGRGAGSLIGGYLIENIGIFQTFRIMAAIGGTSGAIYLIINLVFFRNKNQKPVTDVQNNEILKTVLENKLPDAAIFEITPDKPKKQEEDEIKVTKPEENDDSTKTGNEIQGIENKSFENDTCNA